MKKILYLLGAQYYDTRTVLQYKVGVGVGEFSLLLLLLRLTRHQTFSHRLLSSSKSTEWYHFGNL